MPRRAEPNMAGEKYGSNAMSLDAMGGLDMEAMAGELMREQMGTGPTVPAAAPAPAPPRRQPQVDFSKWQTIYPNYMDTEKTAKKGRKIPKEKACPSPITMEIAEIADYLKIPHVIEPYKCYPRDWMVQGRLRVQFKNERTGVYHNSEIKTKKDFMLKAGALIPKLQSRKKRLEQEATAKASAAMAGGGTASVSKKKGKKKGRR